MQYGYRMGKAALHIAGVTLARDFKKVGIPVGLIHPGVVSQTAKGKVLVNASQQGTDYFVSCWCSMQKCSTVLKVLVRLSHTHLM